ncbi:MAG: PKD domain-containing protein [Mycobacteriales bacterium]
MRARLSLRPAVALAAVLAIATAGVAVANPAAPHVRAPAVFRVGVATVNINPTYPVYMGGYGGGPAGGTLARHVNPLTGKPESFSVRAMAIGEGSHVVEIARVDSQGWFAGYQEGPYGISDVRQAAARFLAAHGAPGATEADIVVSSLHEHAAPTIMGIWGPPAHQLPYLRQVAAATERALAEAWTSARPATLTWGSLDASWLSTTTIANGNANEGWPVDGMLFALWARDARTGATIGTYVVQPGYPNIVNGPADLRCPGGVSAALLSTDFPSYTQNYIEARLGGTALVADGTLGDMPGPMQTDTAPSPDLPPVTVTAAGKTVRCQQTIAFDDAIHMGTAEGNLVMQALGAGHPVTQPTVSGTEQYVVSPGYNPELIALNDVASIDGGGPWAAAGGDSLAYPVDRSIVPPYSYGDAFGTWVTGLRIGGLLLLSEPGEFFPSIHQTWERSIHGAALVVAIGMAQDQLGYDFPVYAYPFTYYSADENTFNPSLTLGDQVTTAGQMDAQALGFSADLTATPETTATGNNYGRVLTPGVQFLTFPQTADASPATGSYTDLLEGFEAAQRFGPTTACSPPVLPSLPSCPVGSPPTMGPYHWSFGDGTTAVTPANNDTYFGHTFAPGHYLVRVSATESDGASASYSLPVTVYPALILTVARHRGVASAIVRGGSGTVLLYRWRLADGRTVYAPTVPVASRPVSVTVVDSSGTIAASGVR